MKKIKKPLVLLTILTLFIIGTTGAYFNSKAQSLENVFTAGTLSVEINQQQVAEINGWKPGDIESYEFYVENTGELPVYIKGYVSGQWNDSALDPSVVEVTSIERKSHGNWIPLVLDDEFYFSQNGSSEQLFELAPQETSEFRVTTKLSETVGDEYQEKQYAAQVHVAARQTNEGASWPIVY